jgi:hypothetical protein
MKAHGVAACRASVLFACAALFALRLAPATAQEIYRWVDEQGVVHFSDIAPAGESAEVSTLTLEDTRPANYDPEQDIYNLEATEQRMHALRDELAAEREARRERAAAQTPAVVQYPSNSTSAIPTITSTDTRRCTRARPAAARAGQGIGRRQSRRRPTTTPPPGGRQGAWQRETEKLRAGRQRRLNQISAVALERSQQHAAPRRYSVTGVPGFQRHPGRRTALDQAERFQPLQDLGAAVRIEG